MMSGALVLGKDALELAVEIDGNDFRPAKPVLSSDGSGSGDGLHENTRAHDALNNAGLTDPLADEEHTVSVIKFGWFIDEHNGVEVTQRHRAASRLITAEPPLSVLTKVNGSLPPCNFGNEINSLVLPVPATGSRAAVSREPTLSALE